MFNSEEIVFHTCDLVIKW